MVSQGWYEVVACVVGRYVGRCNFHAKLGLSGCKVGPASLGWWPRATAFLVDGPDLLLKSVDGCLGPMRGVARLAVLGEAGQPRISTKSIQSTSIV